MKGLTKITFHNTLLIFAFCATTTAFAQDNAETWDAKPTDWKNNRWSFQLATGLNSFLTHGIPMSRNQINYMQTHPEDPLKYKQESRTAGLCYEASFDFRLFRLGVLGLVVNAFKDDEEYLFSDGRSYNAPHIEADSLNELTIRNMQSYLNLGLRYEHTVYHSKSGKHKFFAGLSCGWSINRTPDRTEYDYYEVNHFVPADTLQGKVWYHTNTKFKDGFFMSPSIGYARCFRNQQAIRISMCQLYQWHATEKGTQILDQFSNGVMGSNRYTLRSFQLKLGYSF